jgi:hypothetical protein
MSDICDNNIKAGKRKRLDEEEKLEHDNTNDRKTCQSTSETATRTALETESKIQSDLLVKLLRGTRKPNVVTTTIVVKLRRSGDKIVQNCDIYIGREYKKNGWNLACSKWHNPFSIQSCGGDINKCLQTYRKYLMHPKQAHLIRSLPELRGKILGCWCKHRPNASCHGDILVQLLNETTLVKSNESSENKIDSQK